MVIRVFLPKNATDLMGVNTISMCGNNSIMCSKKCNQLSFMSLAFLIIFPTSRNIVA